MGVEFGQTDLYHSERKRGIPMQGIPLRSHQFLRKNPMITGAHVLLYSQNADADRAFFRDVLGFASVDAGHGWLIFKLPRSEAALHPADNSELPHAGHRLLGAVLYLMCDDLQAYMQSLKSRDISCTEIEEERWGIRTTIRLPSGGEIGLYQPKHPTALDFGT
jgi:catechol 2,3-dioxygenase-like lactoylglutathione lyase family enzyme